MVILLEEDNHNDPSSPVHSNRLPLFGQFEDSTSLRPISASLFQPSSSSYGLLPYLPYLPLEEELTMNQHSNIQPERSLVPLPGTVLARRVLHQSVLHDPCTYSSDPRYDNVTPKIKWSQIGIDGSIFCNPEKNYLYDKKDWTGHDSIVVGDRHVPFLDMDDKDEDNNKEEASMVDTTNYSNFSSDAVRMRTANQALCYNVTFKSLM